MTLRIFHTADLHIGLKFTRGGYPPDLRGRLVNQRIETLRGMVDLANERACDLLVVAGDLFDHPRVQKGVVRRAGEILARFEGVVAVLPGNHDYVQEEDPLWPDFMEALGEGHHLLRQEEPCDLTGQGIPAVLFPGVCTSRHSKENAVGWIPGALEDLSLEEGVLRIGVAHGSLEGLSPDFDGDYFPMTEAELRASGLDLWLLGHTHIRHPDRDRLEGDGILFPATPEPDGFDCRHGGYAWVLEISDSGEASGESVPTGTFRFRSLERTVGSEEELDRLRSEFAGFDADRDLVKLHLSGRLPGDLFEARREWIGDLEPHVLYLEADLSGLVREIRLADIEGTFTEGSFPYRLLAGLAGEGGDPEALQLAWDLVREARS
jgi:DNA repair exonuclease SbcCD nuclease subunit